MKIKQRVRNKKINKNKKSYTISSLVYKRRFIVLKVVLILLFLGISFRLYQVMLRNQSKYQELLENLSTGTVLGDSTPRGRILDRNLKVLVDNKAVRTIYYRKDKKRSSSDEIRIAYLVVDHLNLDYDKVTDRNKRELSIQRFLKKELLRKNLKNINKGNFLVMRFMNLS